MNKDIVNKLRTAGEYEKIAIHALLPERAVGHIEVIEKELHSMFMEMAVDIISYEEKVRNDKHQNDVEKEKASKVKKINIG